MKKAALIAIAFAASVATAQPGIAQDLADSTTPVSILACGVDRYVYPDDLGLLATTDTTVRIAFVNRTSQTIRDVTFRVDANVLGGARTIGDIGRFPTGVPIQHTYGPFGDVSHNARCDVASVTFEDGTLWSRKEEAR
jgi:hypothetical protein